MAELYKVISTEPTVELIPPNKVRPMRILTARALPSGVVFFVPIRPADFGPQHVALIAHDLAVLFNALAAKPGVVGVTVEQSVTPTEVLTQKVRVVVESSSGDSSDDVVLSWGDALGPSGYKLIAAARAQLDAIEGL